MSDPRSYYRNSRIKMLNSKRHKATLRKSFKLLKMIRKLVIQQKITHFKKKERERLLRLRA